MKTLYQYVMEEGVKKNKGSRKEGIIKKTKIAARLMIATGVIILISSVIEFFMSILEGGLYGHPDFVNNISVIIAFLSILFIPFAIFVLKRKKWAWVGSILSFCFLVACFIRVIIYDFPIFIGCINSEISRPFIIEVEKIEYVDIGGGQRVPSQSGYRYVCRKDLLLLPESKALFDSIFGAILLPVFYSSSETEFSEGIGGLMIRTILLILFILLPPALFLFDRKNYWKIASRK